MVSLDELLQEMLRQQASDLYVSVDVPAQLRINHELHPLGEALSIETVTELVAQAMGAERFLQFCQQKEGNMALVRPFARFRVSG
ncbi:MAG: hypothetical protein ACRDC9_10995, partial [Plesiomonas shigelloides]